MNRKWLPWLIGALALAVIVAGIYFPILRKRLRQATPASAAKRRASPAGIDADRAGHNQRADDENTPLLVLRSRRWLADAGCRRSAACK